MDAAPIAYAKSGDVHVAYQVLGGRSGGGDLVFVPGFVSHLECAAEEPSLARFLRRLASFARVTAFDKRGTGLSDRTGRLPSLEERMDDIRAVMDAAGVEQAALFGVSEGGPLTLLFAATYPERVRALALYGTWARVLEAPDYPWGVGPGLLHEFAAGLEEGWGTGIALAAFAPSRAEDARFLQWWARFQRLSASPADARAVIEGAAEIDVRHALPTVTAPALVLHRTGDRLFSVEGGRYLAEHLPNCRFVEHEGSDHLFWTEGQDELLDEVEEFLTGARAAPDPDRVLATILVTDIVGSTRRAAELGDAAWRRLLDSHDALVRQELGRYLGREVKATGDGFVARFDGPLRAIRCAQAIAAGAPALGLDVRSGLHTGECELRGDDLGGLAMHVAARVAAEAGPGEVLVSRTVTDLLAGSEVAFDDRGERELKGVPGSWRLFAVG
ncbi:MAG TPA: adenylate/guanylate cyclase domain-containing protein [Gaiellaceae bacterium]|nr:adenylate/guanylate cyclase domain-containing protein [Gaiellaceae bacterium]